MSFDPKIDNRNAPSGHFIHNTSYSRPCRFLDVLVAVLLLLITLPLMLLVAAAVKGESHGPVFIGENRITRGRRFKLLSYRTTTADARGRQTPRRSGGSSTAHGSRFFRT